MDISVIWFCNNTRKKLFCIQFWYILDVEHVSKKILEEKFCVLTSQTLINLAWEELIILIPNIFLQDNIILKEIKAHYLPP